MGHSASNCSSLISTPLFRTALILRFLIPFTWPCSSHAPFLTWRGYYSGHLFINPEPVWTSTITPVKVSVCWATVISSVISATVEFLFRLTWYLSLKKLVTALLISSDFPSCRGSAPEVGQIVNFITPVSSPIRSVWVILSDVESHRWITLTLSETHFPSSFISPICLSLIPALKMANGSTPALLAGLLTTLRFASLPVTLNVARALSLFLICSGVAVTPIFFK